jgi:hypothetical protein
MRAARLDRRALSRASPARVPEDARRVQRLQPLRKPWGSGRNRQRSGHPVGGWRNAMMPAISPLDLFQLALALIVALAYRRFLI